MNKLIKNKAHSYLCILGKVCCALVLIQLISGPLKREKNLNKYVKVHMFVFTKMNRSIKRKSILVKVCGARVLIGLITTQLNLSTKASVPAGKLDESHKQRFSDKIFSTFRHF